MKVKAIKADVDGKTKELQEVVEGIVSEYSADLDEYMKIIDDALCSDRQPTTAMLEEMLLNLNSILYWVGNGLERATLKESIAKLVKEERYNKEYADAVGTIGDKTAKAKLESMEEELTKQCFTNAVKLYQHKIDRASEMSSSLKKIITHRISEMELSRSVI